MEWLGRVALRWTLNGLIYEYSYSASTSSLALTHTPLAPCVRRNVDYLLNRERLVCATEPHRPRAVRTEPNQCSRELRAGAVRGGFKRFNTAMINTGRRI
jgi:hypothetical protein